MLKVMLVLGHLSVSVVYDGGDEAGFTVERTDRAGRREFLETEDERALRAWRRWNEWANRLRRSADAPGDAPRHHGGRCTSSSC